MGGIVTETKKSWELKFSVVVAWAIFAFSLTKMSVTGSKSSKSLPVESKDLFVPPLSDLAQGILFDLYSGDFVSCLYKKNYFDHHFSFFFFALGLFAARGSKKVYTFVRNLSAVVNSLYV